MTLRSFDVQSPQGDLLLLQLDEPTEGIVVKEIEGLDPVHATVVSTSFAQLDGTMLQSIKREERNIKIKLGVEPDIDTGSVRDIRSRLYRFFMPKSVVKLRFYDNDVAYWIEGVVEDFPFPLFTDDPEGNASIICNDPNFFNPIARIVEGTTTSSDDELEVNYGGSIETGIRFQLFPDRDVDAFEIYHRRPDNSLRTLEFALSESDPLSAGTVLTITTQPGAKGVSTLDLLGTERSPLYAVSPTSDWIQMQPGINHLRVYANGAPVPFQIEYTEKFGGL